MFASSSNGQQAYKLLTEDRHFREAYIRVTERDESYLKTLERQRDEIHSKVESARAKGVKPPTKFRGGAAPTSTPSSPSRSQVEIDERKEMLRQRLAKNNERRRSNEEAKTER